MKKISLPLVVCALGLAFSSLPVSAADAKAEMSALRQKIITKLQSGKKAESDFADELKEFDSILTEHSTEKTDDVANVLFMKASLYLELFDNDEKATELFKEVQAKFPESGPGKRVDGVLASIEKGKEAKKIQRSLTAGVQFPEFGPKTDLEGKPLSVSNYKGKIVMIDFWATWCGPCRGEIPNVVKAYQKYHDKGFEVIGVSLDQDKEALTKFIKENQMTWPQYFDGKGWQNEVSTKYGVNSIPASYLLDKEGKIIASELRGEELEAAVAKAVGR